MILFCSHTYISRAIGRWSIRTQHWKLRTVFCVGECFAQFCLFVCFYWFCWSRLMLSVGLFWKSLRTRCLFWWMLSCFSQQHDIWHNYFRPNHVSRKLFKFETIHRRYHIICILKHIFFGYSFNYRTNSPNKHNFHNAVWSLLYRELQFDLFTSANVWSCRYVCPHY